MSEPIGYMVARRTLQDGEFVWIMTDARSVNKNFISGMVEAYNQESGTDTPMYAVATITIEES